MTNNDKPEPGKVYSLYNLSRRGTWKDAEVKRDGLTVGQVVSYRDMANPLQQAVVIEPDGAHGQKCVFLDDGHPGYVSSSFIGHSWQLVDRIMTVEEIAVAVDIARVAQATKKQDQEAAKAENAREIAALPAKYPHLKPGHGNVNAAKNIRIELKRAFPRVKFSVTCESFSMGNSIDVRWTDGPTTKQVEGITDRYEAGSFDGMTDCYNYSHSAFGDVFGTSKYIHTSRTFSEKLVTKAILAIVAEYGIKDLPTPEEYRNGNAYGTPLGSTAQAEHHWTWQSLINRTAGEISIN